MQDLRVIGAEDGSLLLTSQEGTRFRLAVDETLRSRLKQASPIPRPSHNVSPREIQAHIRSGLSGQEVADLTGAPIEYVQRFETPVIAERQYIVESALAVPVHTAEDSEPLGEGPTFGSVIAERLNHMSAEQPRWSSWKEPEGWVVKLSFTVKTIEHDARWRFEPRKSALAPLNSDATALSQQGPAPDMLIPRLRAVGADDRGTDQTRFDSAAFAVTRHESDGAVTIEPVALPPEPTRPQHAAVARLGERREVPSASTATPGQTADLLEALRRRRGEREAAQYEPEPSESSPGRGIRLVEVALDQFGASEGVTEPADARETPSASASDPNVRTQTQPLPQQTEAEPSAPQRPRKGRAAMPSWDEIVFGARSDDDPA
ncbi:septation protein SepH [Ruicaihuangia caeni]|uniref:Septation protein SepH n=1 Tax=Ruicaihuangia caeni TaxID=3042517 RepID=A0AAW6T6P2_9MICO|nr:septation protein SepH [Klugiella sp. YN-L-19]MDI2098023.1 septation protein SepH [Klugiella sp. YN-L-19]